MAVRCRGSASSDDDGTVRHFCTNGASMAEGHWRGMDLFSPVWNLFDLLPEGRGEWWPSLAYDET